MPADLSAGILVVRPAGRNHLEVKVLYETEKTGGDLRRTNDSLNICGRDQRRL
jgi:hypothetical protein